MSQHPELDEAYKKDYQKLFSTLSSSPKGLTSQEVSDRIDLYGQNTLPITKPPGPIQILLRQFTSPFAIVLLFALILTFIWGDLVDTFVIAGALALDAIIGFVQEYQSSKIFEQLQEKSRIRATVFRDGRMQEIDGSEIVPGDVLIVKFGDKIPADGRIFRASTFEVDESMLTGESLPQKKSTDTIREDRSLGDRDNMVFMGTNVTEGSAHILVTGTGKHTAFGEISVFVTERTEEKTFLQKEIAKLSKTISIILAGAIFLMLIIGFLRGNPLSELMPETVALAVSAIPESLPVIVTVIFAIGMRRILRNKGLVKKLMATETLGRTEVLCIDKTGTLTKGIMSVRKLATLDGTTPVHQLNTDTTLVEEIAKATTLCNQSFKDDGKYKGNPTDNALLKFGHNAGYTKEKLLADTDSNDVLPFDPRTKMSIAAYEKDGATSVFICGAPEVVINKSSHVGKNHSRAKDLETSALTEKERRRLLSLNSENSDDGYRVIAVARKISDTPPGLIDKNIDSLTFLGLLVISDPLRNSSKETVRLAQRAGITLVMITGDHPKTALNIAREVGIATDNSQVMTGKKLNSLSDKELDERIESVKVFARASPFDKVKIVKSFKRKGKIVAMTGDGVNDAPALKLADIGTALGSGTEVAKEAADIVLLNNNLQTILNTVREGRGILDNIKKTVSYLLSDTFSEVVVVGTAIFLGYPLPILPAQLLWVNLIEDGLPDVALALEKPEKDTMSNHPKEYKKPIIDAEVKTISFVISWINDIALLGLFFYYHSNGYDIEFTRTMVFAALSADSLFFAYACKSLRQPLWKIPLFSNKLLNFSFVFGVVLLIAALYLPPLQTLLKTVPIGMKEWGIIIGIGLINLISIEIVKEVFLLKRLRESKDPL